MSQKFDKEYQIPSGPHHPKSQSLIHDELDGIYQNFGETSETPTYIQFENERDFSPASKRLKDISKSIFEARKNQLDSRFFSYAEGESGFIRSIAKKMFNTGPKQMLRPLTLEQLIREEGEIGGGLFGDRPSNEHLVFFKDHHDLNSWYFHQEKTDRTGNSHFVTFHYEVRPSEVLRVTNRSDKENISYEFINGQELDNFMLVTEMYYDRVMRQVYGHELNGAQIIDIRKHNNKHDHSADKKAA